MKKLIAILAATLILIAGCASIDTPTKKLTMAKVTYASIVQGGVAAYNAGDISADDFVNRWEPIRAVAWAGIESADRAIKTDDPDVGFYVSEALRLVNKLQTLYEAFK